MVHRPTWVGNVGSCVGLPGVNFSVSTFGLLVDPLRNIEPAIADQMFGWLALSDLIATD